MSNIDTTLREDLSSLSIPCDFEIVVKPFSKQYNGRYVPGRKRLILYRYQDELCTKQRPYKDLLATAIHEATHHYQWYHERTFSRIKGVMHNNNFKVLERSWVTKAKETGLFDKEVLDHAESHYCCMGIAN